MDEKSNGAQELTALLEEDKGNELKENSASALQKIKGLFAACLWIFFMIMSTVSVQLLEKRIPDFELNTFRCTLPLLMSSFGILLTRKWPVIDKKEIISTSLYSLLGFLCTMTVYISATLLPVASVQSLSQTANITTGIILFFVFLDEKPTILIVISALMCISGVMLVIQPNFIFIQRDVDLTAEPGKWNKTEITSISPNFTQVEGKLSNNVGIPIFDLVKYALPLVNGLSMTLDVVVVKKRPYISEHIVEVLFWCFLSNAVLSLVVMFIVETPLLPGNWYDTLLVTLHCISYLFIWPLYLFAVKYISGNTFTLVSSTIVVFMLIAQYSVLSSILPGNRNWIEIVGVILVLLGSTLESIFNIFGHKI